MISLPKPGAHMDDWIDLCEQIRLAGPPLGAVMKTIRYVLGSAGVLPRRQPI